MYVQIADTGHAEASRLCAQQPTLSTAGTLNRECVAGDALPAVKAVCPGPSVAFVLPIDPATVAPSDSSGARMASISRTIAITGANGNIGQKLAAHLLAGTTTIKGEVSACRSAVPCSVYHTSVCAPAWHR